VKKEQWAAQALDLPEGRAVLEKVAEAGQVGFQIAGGVGRDLVRAALGIGNRRASLAVNCQSSVYHGSPGVATLK